MIIYVLMIVISVLRGNKRNPSVIGLGTCSSTAWVLFFIFIIVDFALWLVTIKLITKKYEEKVRLNY